MVHSNHRIVVGISINRCTEGLSHCVFRAEQQLCAVRVHNHVLLPSQHISLIEIAAVNHIHRLHILIIIVNALKLKLDGGALILGIRSGVRVAVNIGDLIGKCLLGPFHFIQVKIIAISCIFHPISNAHIRLCDSHVLIQIGKHPPHGVADGHNSNYRSDPYDNPQHGKQRPQFIGPDSIKRHDHIFP